MSKRKGGVRVREEEAVVEVHTVSISTITNCILGFMLFIAFSSMVVLVVALCRMDRIEKSIDTLAVSRAVPPPAPPATIITAPSYVPLSAGAVRHYAPPPLPPYPPTAYDAPIQLPIAPPSSIYSGMYRI